MEKSEIITFKADPALKAALEGVPNRSEFIRAAVLAALDGVCPFCRGTGILTPHQQQHWRDFSRNHTVRECDECHGLNIRCGTGASTR